MEEWQTNFEKEYGRLNKEQRQAVDSIEGPVMVVAGAGTGKTQVIALRIANILHRTQVNPSNVLCLTFTDSGAANMRERLTAIIGPTASAVKISTFHGFCTGVIRQHPEYFWQFQSESEPLDKIEQIEIGQKLIDQLPLDSPLRSPSETYFYRPTIIEAIEALKKENIGVDRYEELVSKAEQFVTVVGLDYQQLKGVAAYPKNQPIILQTVERILKLPDLSDEYRRKLSSILSGLTGAKEMKMALVGYIDRLVSQLPKQKALIGLYRGYQTELLARRKYDFDDMILSVIQAFSKESVLLAEYQERYQYVLVDEYQDTSSSQNQILEMLTLGQESPNIFVVGDDDQSIFRFQGASVENVYSFYEKYQTTPIVLRNNYRSHQLILDSSQSVIERNINRLSRQIKEVDKSLVTTREYDADPINILAAESETEEKYFVAKKIKTLIAGGVRPGEIAILCRNNSDISDIALVLTQEKVRFVKDYGINIRQIEEIQSLWELLKLVANPDDELQKKRVLNCRFMRLPAVDLFWYLRGRPIEELSDKFRQRFKRFEKRLMVSQKKKSNYSAEKMFNWAIRKFGVLRFILKQGNIELLKQLNRYYAEFRQLAHETGIDFDGVVAKLAIGEEQQIQITSPPLLADIPECVRLMTIHRAKGREFEQVFLYRVLASRWEEARGRSRIDPPLGVVGHELLNPEYDVELEENRRLFYVALTRAKNQIYISYTKKNYEGREQSPSRFIGEIDPKLIELVANDANLEKEALVSLYGQKTTSSLGITIGEYLSDYLTKHYRLNITHINSYHKCPYCFFVKTILRLPQAKTKPLSYGTAIHGALAYLSASYNRTKVLISREKLLEVFVQNLVKENLATESVAELTARGERALGKYYDYYFEQLTRECLVEHDFRPYRAEWKGIPITGKVDRIEVLDNQEVRVVDYKTGQSENKYRELGPEGDYFRQLVFYKILAENSQGFPYRVKSGVIDFVEPDKSDRFVKREYEISDEAVTKMEEVIKDTWGKITSLAFEPNQKCDDRERWHRFYGKWFATTGVK